MKVFRAIMSSYIVLGLPCILPITLYSYIWFIQKKNVSTVLIGLIIVLSLIYTWLRGFRIVITEQTLSYRDGLYRTTTIQRTDIKKAKHAWVEFGRLRADLKIPRFLIILKDGSQLLINDKPFSREAISELNNLINK